MTGQDVVKLALQRLGEADPMGGVNRVSNADLIRVGLDAVNAVLFDVSRITGCPVSPLKGLGEPVPVEETVARRVMPWGVASLLAGTEGDDVAEERCQAQYDRARRGVSSAPRRVEERLPKPMM